MLFKLFSFAFCLTLMGWAGTPDAAYSPVDQSQQIENLRAFAKLYGYVRYFHPSDEASRVEWDRFVVLGITKVKAAKDAPALQQALRDLFLPIAPSIQIYATAEGPLAVPDPVQEPGQVLVTWQYLGYGFGTDNFIYKNVRLGRAELPDGTVQTNSGEAVSQSDVLPGALFSTHATPADVITRELCRGLSCRIPMALYLAAEPPTVYLPSFNQLKGQLDRLQTETASAVQEATRVGAVIESWNVFNHFYPYFDVVHTNWDSMLTVSLAHVLDTKNTAECHRVLRQMVAALEDGHGRVNHPSELNMKPLPAVFDWVEGKVVVMSSNSDQLKKGDVLVEYDGKPAAQCIADWEQISSGSPQIRTYKALLSFTMKDSTNVSKLVLERNGTIIKVTEDRKLPKPAIERPANVAQVADGIYYVNLDKAEMDEIDAKMNEIASAKGVIFDLRGYPRGNHGVINHLIDKPVQSAQFHVPEIIFPDMQHLTGYDTTGRWSLYPEAPRIKGKVVFLTGGSAISYAESVMGIIGHYHLATIIGSTTAGANGNVNPFVTVGGFRFSWTGMKVLKQDGSQHHLVGIHPDITVSPTIKGIREGRDEVLERGVAFLR